jgi:hypothetical protein
VQADRAAFDVGERHWATALVIVAPDASVATNDG